MLAGKPALLDVACKAPVQRWVLYVYHHETVSGLTKENKITEVVAHIETPIEYMKPPCSSTRDAWIQPIHQMVSGLLRGALKKYSVNGKEWLLLYL